MTSSWIIPHRLADAVFPGFGDTDLPRFAVVALHQIERRVQLAAGAAAVGLAALAAANGEGSAEEPVVVAQLGEPGTKAPLGRRYGGTGDLRYYGYLRPA